jgi:hypothetical protein
MPRPKKTPGNDVVAMADIAEEVEVTTESPDLNEDQIREEFNEHIKLLVQNFVQQEISGLEERIRDLEMLLLTPKVLSAEEAQSVVPDYRPGADSVEEYSPAHQGGDGTPWYHG